MIPQQESNRKNDRRRQNRTIMKNRDNFLELLLLNSKDKKKYQQLMKEFLVTEGKGPKAYCPIQFVENIGVELT